MTGRREQVVEMEKGMSWDRMIPLPGNQIIPDDMTDLMSLRNLVNRNNQTTRVVLMVLDQTEDMDIGDDNDSDNYDKGIKMKHPESYDGKQDIKADRKSVV